MKKALYIFIFGLILVPSVSYAQTSSQPTNQQLQQLIAALTTRVQALETQLATVTSTKTIAPQQKQDSWTSCKIADEELRDKLADIEKDSSQKEYNLYSKASNPGKSTYTAITKLRKETAADTEDIQEQHDDLRKECKDKGVRLEQLNVGQNSSGCGYTLDKKGKLLRQCA